MTLKEFMENLNKFIEENPEALNMLVVYSSDDEGNKYHPVVHEPVKGIYENGGFFYYDNYEEWNKKHEETNAVCAVCIN